MLLEDFDSYSGVAYKTDMMKLNYSMVPRPIFLIQSEKFILTYWIILELDIRFHIKNDLGEKGLTNSVKKALSLCKTILLWS